MSIKPPSSPTQPSTVANELVNSPFFDKKPVERKKDFAKAYEQAAANGDVKSMKKLTTRICKAYKYAATKNDAAVIREIDYSLSRAYQNSIKNPKETREEIGRTLRKIELALRQVFAQAAASGNLDTIKRIEQLPGFATISLSAEFGLVQAYAHAVEKSQNASMREIEHVLRKSYHTAIKNHQAKKKKEILSKYGQIYASAAASDNLDAMKRIEEWPGFNNTFINDEFGFAQAYAQATANGKEAATIKMEDLLIQAYTVAKTKDDVETKTKIAGLLGRVYASAAENDNVHAMKRLEQWPEFAKIVISDEFHFIKAYEQVAKYGKAAAMREMELILSKAYAQAATDNDAKAMRKIENILGEIYFPKRIDQVEMVTEKKIVLIFGQHFVKAAEEGNLDAMESIKKWPGFDKTFIKDEFGFTLAYEQAAKKGQEAAMRKMELILSEMYVQAVIMSNPETMKAIELLPVFDKMPVDGAIDVVRIYAKYEILIAKIVPALGKIYARARANENLDAMKRIEQCPEFAKIVISDECCFSKAYAQAIANGKEAATRKMEDLLIQAYTVAKTKDDVETKTKIVGLLGRVYASAAENDNVHAMKRLEQWPEFAKIVISDEFDFIKAYEQVAKYGKAAAMREMGLILSEANAQAATNDDAKAMRKIKKILRYLLDNLNV